LVGHVSAHPCSNLIDSPLEPTVGMPTLRKRKVSKCISSSTLTRRNLKALGAEAVVGEPEHGISAEGLQGDSAFSGSLGTLTKDKKLRNLV
jgi:hypothetical protein